MVEITLRKGGAGCGIVGFSAGADLARSYCGNRTWVRRGAVGVVN